jgi:hypothetical protein
VIGNLLAAAVAWVFLPAGAFWTSVAPAGGTLQVSGTLAQGAGCAVLSVDPTSLHTSLAGGACSPHAPRFVYDRASQRVKVFVGRRFAFRYSDASDSKPVWATAGGSLWVYDVATDSGPLLVRYSFAGRLQQRVRFPRLYKPVLAANAAGAFLMANPSGGVSGERTAALYYVSPRATAPRVLQHGTRAALWMAAHGHTLWLGTVTGTTVFTLWRYDGTHGRTLWTRSSSFLLQPTYGGGALWSVAAPYCAEHLRAVRLDPLTGAEQTVATVPLLDCNQLGAGAYYRGWFWFVDGDKLYRVR